MATLEDYKRKINELQQTAKSRGLTVSLLRKYKAIAVFLLEDLPEQREKAFDITKYVKEICKNAIRYQDDDYDKLYWETLLWEARNRNVDSYLLYLERKREYKNRFYEPRRSCFMKIGLIQALQDIIDDKLDILSISLPPGTGKTTIEKMLHTALCGWYPEEYSLFYSHSGDITRMYYDGVLDILSNDEEYAWSEIFPNCRIWGTNAKMQQITINEYKSFPNVQCTSVDSKNAGKVRASLFLLCDDLIGGIEEAMNRNLLDKLWGKYSVDGRQRKVTGCKEIHIATRWSVHDCIGRLQRAYEGNDRCRFIAVPDIDPVTGKSNFEFDLNPFTVEFYHDQAKLMDEVSYRCLYKNEPIEREGLLFPADSLRRYTNLPNRDPDEITFQCDHKGSGTDFMFMPILYRYGDDYYAVDCVCNRENDYETQYQNLTNLIVEHKAQNGEFESNMGGDRVAMEVNERVEKRGWICNITTSPTESNKEARIYQCASWIKQHVLFLDNEKYAYKSDYAEMMGQLVTYSTSGKNPNDDIPDCFSNFALRVNGANKTAKVEAVYNPFRSVGRMRW